MARGADSLFEVGGRSLFDESDITAPAPAPANQEDANPMKVLKDFSKAAGVCRRR